MITEDIRYIGVNDHDIDLFEGQYQVPNGISYNSYVIMDEKIAIMDTVDKRKQTEFLENLETALAGRTPDYLVISHMEPDHASSIQAVVERYPEITLVGNAKTFPMLKLYFDLDTSRALTVKEGDTLKLGRHELTFVMAPMVHWPEVMVSYDSCDKVLFSADGFGEKGMVDAGGLATYGIDYYQLGYMTGEQAVKILTEGADISKMPIGYLDASKCELSVNEETAETLGIDVSGLEK